MSVWRWADWIETVPAPARISLGEGETPLLRSRHIGPALGLANLYFKLESGNPTGSYKDRFAAVAVSDLAARGKTLCLGTSSGNTGAALAAYCAAAGIDCKIAVVEKAPADKVRQMLVYGSQLFRVRGFGLDPEITSEVFGLLAAKAGGEGVALQVSAFKYNPAGMTGVQTISYELNEQLPEAMAHVFCPAGGGGLALAVARGFALLAARGKLKSAPCLECVQPMGNDTMAGPLARGERRAHPARSSTAISGLQVANVIDGDEVIQACRASRGTGHLVSDEEVWAAQKQLSAQEGIFCEPAGAVALAGALKAASAHYLRPEAAIVCLVTGSGFKDAASLDKLPHAHDGPMLDAASLNQALSGLP